ncbi:MAG: hypothetical protein E6I22_07665 [Chloroflexi bacterium]|nr:MAG: hypothetical protein E6I22_07665 [Chloroflexota bacterium]
MIWAIVVVLGLIWLLGFSLHVAGGLIFLLLALAVIGVLYNLLVAGTTAGHHHHTTEVSEVEHTDL